MINQSLIYVDDKNITTRDGAIDQLIKIAFENGYLTEVEEFKKSVLDREDSMSTAVGREIAIPHGMSNAVTNTFVVCGKFAQSVSWDVEEVKLVFLIGVSIDNRNNEHLKVLATLSRNLMVDEFRLGLLEAKTNDQMFEILKEIDN